MADHVNRQAANTARPTGRVEWHIEHSGRLGVFDGPPDRSVFHPYSGEQGEQQHAAKSEVRKGRSVGSDVGEYDWSYCVNDGHHVHQQT
jgi:hypothetical protein